MRNGLRPSGGACTGPVVQVSEDLVEREKGGRRVRERVPPKGPESPGRPSCSTSRNSRDFPMPAGPVKTHVLPIPPWAARRARSSSARSPRRPMQRRFCGSSSLGGRSERLRFSGRAFANGAFNQGSTSSPSFIGTGRGPTPLEWAAHMCTLEIIPRSCFYRCAAFAGFGWRPCVRRIDRDRVPVREMPMRPAPLGLLGSAGSWCRIRRSPPRRSGPAAWPFRLV